MYMYIYYSNIHLHLQLKGRNLVRNRNEFEGVRKLFTAEFDRFSKGWIHLWRMGLRTIDGEIDAWNSCRVRRAWHVTCLVWVMVLCDLVLRESTGGQNNSLYLIGNPIDSSARMKELNGFCKVVLVMFWTVKFSRVMPLDWSWVDAYAPALATRGTSSAKLHPSQARGPVNSKGLFTNSCEPQMDPGLAWSTKSQNDLNGCLIMANNQNDSIMVNTALKNHESIGFNSWYKVQ